MSDVLFAAVAPSPGNVSIVGDEVEFVQGDPIRSYAGHPWHDRVGEGVELTGGVGWASLESRLALTFLCRRAAAFERRGSSEFAAAVFSNANEEPQPLSSKTAATGRF